VTGVVALHGGGEFLPGDEAFLDALIDAAPRRGVQARRGGAPIRAVVVPTAAARGRPGLAAAHGVDALERAAVRRGHHSLVDVARVLDEASARDPATAARIAAADVIHLPGGDPDLIPAIYPGTPAWTAIRTAVAGGAVLAGASAGAMALAELTRTPLGLVAGLGLVPGLVVVPHADAASWDRNLRRFGGGVPVAVGALGLAERTGVIARAGAPWRVVGEGEVRWLPPGETDPARAIVARTGETLPLDPLRLAAA
jgi:cyanophycinase-like exopeptidase